MTKREKQIIITATLVSVFVGAFVLTFILLKKKKGLSKRKLQDLVSDQIKYWDGETETSDRGSEKLKEWWSWFGYNYSLSQLRDPNWQSENYWSSIFISAMMKMWGAGERFKYSAKHSDYICQAKEAREQKDKSKIFWAYTPDEIKVQVGDIVTVPRASYVTLENICGYNPTHGDLVYKIDRSGSGYKAYLIGGNLSNTVKVVYVDLDSDGKLKDPTKYLAILKNRKI
jgi:hypothetical protein